MHINYRNYFILINTNIVGPLLVKIIDLYIYMYMYVVYNYDRISRWNRLIISLNTHIVF